MLLKILLNLVFLINVYSKETSDGDSNTINNITGSQNQSPQNDLSDFMKTTSLVLSDPKLAAAIELIKKLKTESSTSISEVHDAKIGFYELDTSIEIASGMILPNNIDKLMNLWLTNTFFDIVPPVYKSVLSESIKEIALQMENSNYIKQKFSIHFQDGKGTIHMMVISLEYDNVSHGIKWIKQILDGSFVPSRDWVVITRTKSNILSSKSTAEIVYLPPMMTLNHFKDYLEINKQMILSFYNQFSTGFKL